MLLCLTPQRCNQHVLFVRHWCEQPNIYSKLTTTFHLLGLGNIPPGTAPSTLQHLFTPFGTIESVRVLSHKNCGFVNFDSVESASRARDALLQNEIGVPGFGGVRVGFAKVPPAKVAADGNSKVHNTNNNDRASFMDTESWLVDLWKCMQAFGAQDEAMSQVKSMLLLLLFLFCRSMRC